MKAVILAGGFGTRISEESTTRPKPMIEIGGKPILWHIMKMYSAHGINEFIICCGYKGYMIKEYFVNYYLHQSDITVDLKNGEVGISDNRTENWKVTLVDTGESAMTGGRIKGVKEYLNKNEPFCLTYGDGVADINISQLIKEHLDSDKLATVTSVFAPGRFGSLKIENGVVTNFHEKPKGDGIRINGGFFVCSPEVINYIQGIDTVWEKEPLENLANSKQLNSYLHDGFWKPMDTLRDKVELEELWENGNAPWKMWN